MERLIEALSERPEESVRPAGPGKVLAPRDVCQDTHLGFAEVERAARIGDDLGLSW
ncbi:hypothetical protein [Streptomyces sp. NPDC002540]